MTAHATKRAADCIAQRADFAQSLQSCAAAIDTAAAAIARCLRAGGRTYFFGNGGSAAQAQHFAAELSGRFLLERPAWAALALTVDTSAITAIANDYGYERVFARQLEGLVRVGDVAVGLTTSGSSPNVLAGLRTARRSGATTIALTGDRGGPILELADVVVAGPDGPSWKVQEAHLAIAHIICELVEQTLTNE